MSIQYSILKQLMRIVGMKKMYQLPTEQIMKKVEKMNRKRQFEMPKGSKFHCLEEAILEQYHCIRFQVRQEKSDRAVLFLFGGGMIMGPDHGDWNLVNDLAKKTNCDFWFPYYPLCTEHCIAETYEMIFETYRKMVQEYGAENIVVMGFSSGGALSVGLCLYNNATGATIPMPKRVIAISPGAIPMTEEEKENMKKLSEKDVMLDYKFMASVGTAMEHGRKVPDYMLNGTRGDFTGVPPIDFYYGSDETLYGMVDFYTEACRKYNVKYKIHVGEGMCHCYPMLPFFPEGKAAYNEIAEIIKAE